MACSDDTTKSGPLYLQRLPGSTERRPVEPCTDFWTNADIELEGGVGSAPADPNDPPIENRIRVTVRNAGSEPVTNVFVQVWVCDYNVGVGPVGGIPSAGGAKGLGPRRMGTIAAGGSRTVVLLWNATHEDAVRNPDGHHCIIANAYGADPDTGVEIPTSPLPVDPIAICCDSHHGWRNITLAMVSLKKIEQEGGLRLPMLVGNPTAADLDGIVTVRQVRDGFGPVERDLLLSAGAVAWTDPREDPDCARLVLAGFPEPKPIPVRPSRRELPEVGFTGDLGEGDAVRFGLGPDDVANVAIRVAFDAGTRPGEVFVLEAVQSDARDEILSGARSVVVVTP